MIYVSSSCVHAGTIGEAVRKLADAGYVAIELSGGTRPYDKLEEELLSLKGEYGLSYLCHNYFPPPLKPFVVNLASLDDEISRLSVEHLQRSISLSARLGAAQFGFHAGFLMDIPLNEIGQSIARKTLFGREEALNRFVENLRRLEKSAGDVKLYVENNVVSSVNLSNYDGTNPLLITDSEGYEELKRRIPFGLLLDVAHLKVSCQSLGLDFQKELSLLLPATDYIHVSDNDSYSDNNQSLVKGSALWKALSHSNLKEKTVTLEVYTGPDELRSSFESLLEIV
jgi:sugar phosphate isomerase/epimerase